MGTTTRTTDLPTPPPAERPADRLDFLDGARALAALCVVLYHVSTGYAVFHPGWSAAHSLFAPLGYGHFAVDVFIVLSGYCLMMPVARAGIARPYDVGAFFKRRARRILPPYYAAFVLAFALNWAVVTMKRNVGVSVGEGDYGFSAGSVLTHLFLVHNWFRSYYMSTDGPLWTVAAEWQIYFLFALVLLPLCRRLGIAAALAAGLAAGLLPMMLGGGRSLEWTSPWYVGLFALGATGAVLDFGGLSDGVSARVPWMPAAVVIAAASVAAASFWGDRMPLCSTDILVGAATACGIVGLRRADAGGPAVRRIERALASRPLTAIGRFSYSLYLVHAILLSRLLTVLASRHLSEAGFLAGAVVGALPIVLGGAYLFHLVFERPFLKRPDEAAARVPRYPVDALPGLAAAP